MSIEMQAVISAFVVFIGIVVGVGYFSADQPPASRATVETRSISTRVKALENRVDQLEGRLKWPRKRMQSN